MMNDLGVVPSTANLANGSRNKMIAFGMANNSVSYNFDSTENSSISGHMFTPNVGVVPADLNKLETITTFDTIPFGSLGRFSKSIDRTSKKSEIKRERYNNTCTTSGFNNTQTLN